MATLEVSLAQGISIFRSDLLRFFADQAPLQTLELRLSTAEGVAFRLLQWNVEAQDHEQLAEEISSLISTDKMSVTIKVHPQPSHPELTLVIPIHQRVRPVRKMAVVEERYPEPQKNSRRAWPRLGQLVVGGVGGD